MDSTLGSVRRWLPGSAGRRFVGALAERPGMLARRGAELVGELARVAAGDSELAPPKGDRRFADKAWSENALLWRLVQAYLATGRTLEQLVEDAELDWRSEQRVRFLVDNLVEALSPSNSPVLNPVALRAAIDSRGASYARGLRNLVNDLADRPRVPAMVDEDAFTVGVDLAVTPGAVVLRTPVFELIQYAPQTPDVRQVPLLVVPPTINKYYITDLAPGRSMLEHFVRSGQQVLVMSWRNPDESCAEWGFDTYCAAILDALAAVEAICATDRTVLLGLCSGGILTSLTLAHLAATGQQDRVAGLTLGVTVLDQAQAGTAGALLDPELAATAADVSARRGYLDGKDLAEVFAWLRPGDLVWNYWVNNYLLGKSPPAFDVLFWNADTTRMTAALHRDFLELSVANALVTPGKASVLGTPVDLSKVRADAYVIAGVSDHLCPWQSCYRTTQLLGSSSRFVLSTSGHIAALVNPPGNPKASFRTAEENPPDAEAWLKIASTSPGSWWDDYVGWLQERSGPEQAAPPGPGSPGFPAGDPAPGRYVFER